MNVPRRKWSVSWERRQLVWRSQTIGQAQQQQRSCATQSYATHRAHFIDRERALWTSFLETRCLKGRCTAENLAAVSSAGCGETLWAVRRQARKRSFWKLIPNPRWSSQHGCCRQAPWWGRRIRPHTGCKDVQLWQEIIILVDSLCLLFANATGPVSLITVIN